MSEMNDEISKIGAAVHQAAHATQNLEKLYKEAEVRITKIDAQSEQAKKLHAEISELSAAKVKLEEEIAHLKAEKARILASFAG